MLHVNKSFVEVKKKGSDEVETIVLTYHRLLEMEKEKHSFHKFPYHDPEKYLPYPYDLVKLRMDSGKERHGWWEGQSWFCRKMRAGEKVIGWAKACEHYV